MRTRIVAAIVCLAACGEAPLSRCEESVLPDCDPQDTACQTALHEHVACVRGDVRAGAPPPFELGRRRRRGARRGVLPPGHSISLKKMLDDSGRRLR